MTQYTLKQASQLLQSKQISAVELATEYLAAIAAQNPAINGYITLDQDKTLAEARAADARIAQGNATALTGVPIAYKDIFCQTGWRSACSSKMLDNFVSPYTATVVQNLLDEGMVTLGRTNMDEFAMGSTNETSFYGATKNPWNPEHVPGGSSGGSAAVVAARLAPAALGSDTGGSIRQPAALTGSVGVKPTYGSVSRYGVIAMASSLDQVGPCARTVLDTALLHEAIAGHDPLDATSLPDEPGNFVEEAKAGAEAARKRDLSGLRIGVIKELGGGDGAGFEAGVLARFRESVEELRAAGAEIVEVSLPSVTEAISAYYMIMSSEVSSNLARYDGVRYGLRVVPEDGPVTIERVMSATRSAGFGHEVKRSIILGTYALSAGNFDAYYGAALRVRTLIQRDYAAAFEKCDVLISPTAPSTAFKLGEKTEGDPMAMYLGDVATVPVNLAGVPALSLPGGLSEENNLPVGIQFTAPAREDARLYRVGAALEELLTAKWGAPLYRSLPDTETLIRDFDFGGTK